MEYFTNSVRRFMLLVIVLTAMLVAGRQLDSVDVLPINQDLPGSKEEALQGGCWVFHHMVKSGGTTIRSILQRFITRNKIRREIYAENQWMRGIDGTRFAEGVLNAKQGIVDGGYVEGLRPLSGSENCKWFTVFRHPVSRVVSAFYYCKYMHRAICARFGWDLDTLDLLTFAEKWGNYGLRQYALGFLSNEDVFVSLATQDCGDCPGWYLVKKYLAALHQQPQRDNSVTTFGGASSDEYTLYTMLEPALELISSKYAAVGLLEDMPTTMRLFNSALGMDNFNWTIEGDRVGTVNRDHQHKAEENVAVREALTDPAIFKYIWLDLILYEHAKRVHAKQVQEYGLEHNPE